LKTYTCCISLLIIVFCSFNNAKQTVQNSKPDQSIWIVTGVKGKNLILKNGRQLKTSLFDLKYIGALQTQKKAPYYILSGRGCHGCDANISIYIWSPSDGPMLDDSRQPRYTYPGKEKDYETGKPIFESRMFYSDCNVYGNSVIWLQRTLNDKGKWIEDMFVVSLKTDKLQETLITKQFKSSKSTFLSTTCKELPGIDVSSEP